jgi:hypothetical protein
MTAGLPEKIKRRTSLGDFSAVFVPARQGKNDNSCYQAGARRGKRNWKINRNWLNRNDSS